MDVRVLGCFHSPGDVTIFLDSCFASSHVSNLSCSIFQTSKQQRPKFLLAFLVLSTELSLPPISHQPVLMGSFCKYICPNHIICVSSVCFSTSSPLTCSFLILPSHVISLTLQRTFYFSSVYHTFYIT